MSLTAVVRHDPLGDGESEAGPLPRRLGREEWVEDTRQALVRTLGPLVLELPRALAAMQARAPRRPAAPLHGLERVRGEGDEDLADLALVDRDRRERLVELGHEPAFGEAGLVEEELGRLEDERGEVGRGAAAPGIADELEPGPGDLFAPERLLFDPPEVVREVGELERLRAPAFREPLPERLRAARDRRQRVVQLVRDARAEPSRGRQPLGEQHLTLEPLGARDVLHEDDRVGDALLQRLEGRARQPEDLRLPRERDLRLERAAPPRFERLAEERLDHPRLAGAEERRERRALARVAAKRPRALAVRADDAQLRVEDEDSA